MSDFSQPFTAARADGSNPSAFETLGEDGHPVLGALYEVPARQGRAVQVKRGEVLTIINTYGSQVADFWAFCAADPGEHLSMEHLRPSLRKLCPTVGDALVTNRRRAILTFLSDSSKGVHDTLVASCDIHRYRDLGHSGYHDNCTDNLRMALAAINVVLPRVPCPFNLWMNTPARANGDMVWLSPVSQEGDAVSFRAEMDLIAVVSACPMDLLPINGTDAVPRSLSLSVSTES
jgi:uncharacterized protein